MQVAKPAEAPPSPVPPHSLEDSEPPALSQGHSRLEPKIQPPPAEAPAKSTEGECPSIGGAARAGRGGWAPAGRQGWSFCPCVAGAALGWARSWICSARAAGLAGSLLSARWAPGLRLGAGVFAGVLRQPQGYPRGSRPPPLALGQEPRLKGAGRGSCWTPELVTGDWELGSRTFWAFDPSRSLSLGA